MIKGTESAKAVAIPVTKLVAPGPEVFPQRNDPAALVGLHAFGRAPQGHHGRVPPSRLAHRPGVGYGRLHGLNGLGHSAGARQAVRPMSRVF